MARQQLQNCDTCVHNNYTRDFESIFPDWTIVKLLPLLNVRRKLIIMIVGFHLKEEGTINMKLDSQR